MHKSIPVKITRSLGDDGGAAEENKARRKKTDGTIDSSTINNDSLSPKIAVLDIEREDRLSKVISLFSKDLNQRVIALELHVDQSTVSSTLSNRKQESKLKNIYERTSYWSTYDIWPVLMKFADKESWSHFACVLPLLLVQHWLPNLRFLFFFIFMLTLFVDYFFFYFFRQIIF